MGTTPLNQSIWVNENDLARQELLARLVAAATRLRKATAAALSASAANGQADIRVVSDARLGRLRDRHEQALKDQRAAEHEVHCLVVELGLAQPEMERYGQKIEDYTAQHDAQWGYRRFPSTVKQECLGNCTTSCHCNA